MKFKICFLSSIFIIGLVYFITLKVNSPEYARSKAIKALAEKDYSKIFEMLTKYEIEKCSLTETKVRRLLEPFDDLPQQMAEGKISLETDQPVDRRVWKISTKRHPQGVIVTVLYYKNEGWRFLLFDTAMSLYIQKEYPSWEKGGKAYRTKCAELAIPGYVQGNGEFVSYAEEERTN